MNNQLEKPLIKAKQNIPELTFKVIFLAIILTVLLAMSNAYLALRLGLLTSASIPAAIISMGILHLFRSSTILENNAVQTAASAGEAVAGGIVYTIPALIIIKFWDHFDYTTNFAIAVCGGILGVLFSIPLRRILVNDSALKFPEGRAIAEVLKSSAHNLGIRDIFWGGTIGAGLELFQLGFKLIASNWSNWFVMNRSLFGIGAGFSPTMIGAGYLVGYDMAVSIFLGAIISWLIALPIVSQFHPFYVMHHAPEQACALLWNDYMRYLGIGAMLLAGTWTFMKLIKPLAKSMKASFHSFLSVKKGEKSIPRTDKDIPFLFVLIGISLMAVVLFFFFQSAFPLKKAGFSHSSSNLLIISGVFYVLVIGFLFSVITAYFSGMVGVTASPGSSVVIAGMLFAATLLLKVMDYLIPLPLTVEQVQAAEAITIIIGAVVTGIAAIANDNTQDLKVGQLVGATPWKQQVMLLLGVVVSSLVIPPVMQLLFDVYGIAGVMPHPGMRISQSLPAPTAALMAAITEAVFRNSLPWNMLFIGALIILLILFLNHSFKLKRFVNLSILGIAIGMYLPLASTIPMFIGGMVALWVKKRLSALKIIEKESKFKEQKGTLIACGLVAGSALMDVMLAIPFSIAQSPDALQLVGRGWTTPGVYLGILSTVWLACWIKQRVCN